MTTTVKLDDIDIEPAIYTKQMMDSIKNNGVIMPVVLQMQESGRFKVIDGRRRLNVLKEIYKKDTSEIVLDAELIDEGVYSDHMPLVVNYVRSPNFIDDAKIAIKLSKAHSTEKIVELTQIPMATLMKMLKLKTLGDKLFEAFEEGLIKRTIAFEIAKLPEKYKIILEKKLTEKGRLTKDDVSEVKTVMNSGREVLLETIIDDMDKSKEKMVNEVRDVLSHYIKGIKNLNMASEEVVNKIQRM